MPTPTPALAPLLDRGELGFELEGLSSAGRVEVNGCEMVRVRVATIEVVEEVVAEDTDAGNVEEEEEEVHKVRVLEEMREPKGAINCSGDAAWNVSSVGFEQSRLPDP